MEKRITYVAYDGTIFENEKTCRKYEKIKRKGEIEAVQKCMQNLDVALWKKFYPDTEDDSCPELHVSDIWLRNDIIHILSDERFDVDETKNNIWDMIKATKHQEKILSDYIKEEGIMVEVKIKRDFLTALKNVKEGSDLAHEVGYCLSNQDLKKLASLHKANKCRKKIEDLLTACNYHGECSKFTQKEYEDYLEV